VAILPAELVRRGFQAAGSGSPESPFRESARPGIGREDGLNFLSASGGEVMAGNLRHLNHRLPRATESIERDS
jgi:hypothetical protein